MGILRLFRRRGASQKAGGTFRFFLFLFLFAGVTAAGAGAQERRAVLSRGNTWVTGIPGFGSNVFPAVYGEYRLEFSPAGGGDQAVFVWLCGEPLHFAESLWRPWNGSGLSVVQRREGEARLLGFSFSGGSGLGIWTAVFQFPQGIEAAGLDEISANALINKWADRVLYFLFLIKNPADVSLPAAFAF
ncbi:MAG: hypothetical protein LBG10_01315 [Treponema sp.]|jgi:hypothetical protein|nr:hypothetical protein [Treponema sp.]